MFIAICDDDQDFLNSIRIKIVEYFKKKKYNEPTIYSFDTAEKMLKEQRLYDLAFLDVEMPGISGIVASETLKQWNTDILIFIITNHNTLYLDDAMEEGVYRYMMKPINPIQFQVNMNSAIRRRFLHSKTLTVETDTGFVSVNTNDIILIYTEKRRVYMKTTHGTYKTTCIFQYWVNNLPDSSFAQSFKGILVHLKYVRRVGDDIIEMTVPSDPVYLSSRNRATFKKKFMQYINTVN